MLDPVDRVDFGVARVAVLGDPVLDPPTSGIVAGEREDVGRAVGGSARPLLCWLIVHQVETIGFSVCTFRVDRFA